MSNATSFEESSATSPTNAAGVITTSSALLQESSATSPIIAAGVITTSSALLQMRLHASSSRSETLLKDTEADRGDSHGGIPAAYAALGDNDNMFALLFDQIERGDPSRNLLPSIRPL